MKLNSIREPMNSFTHFIGMILSAVAFILMFNKALATGRDAAGLTSIIIFGVSLLLLYSASTVYHAVVASPLAIAWLRKVDHAMIFVLIAGTYTPFCLIALKDSIGYPLLIVIWSIAISGILFKLVWFKCPRFISTALYIGMGWLIVFAFGPLTTYVPRTGVILLIAGGIIYTLGGVIYALKPAFLESKYLGFHEIFHLFILAGSFAHVLAIYNYVL